jgi:hypothetical protein
MPLKLHSTGTRSGAKAGVSPRSVRRIDHLDGFDITGRSVVRVPIQVEQLCTLVQSGHDQVIIKLEDGWRVMVGAFGVMN